MSEEGDLSEMNEDEIESLMLHTVADGLTDVSFKGGEMAFSLTDKGEGQALDLIGGKDVADVASALTKIIADCGDAMGMPVEANVKLWLIMVQIARLWKQYSSMPWDAWVAKLNAEVPERKSE